MKFSKILSSLAVCSTLSIAGFAQLSPITYEPGAHGNAWTWTVFENTATPPPAQVIANPNASGINTSATVLKMTTLIAGNPWAGFESSHGAGIGTFTLNSSNAIVKLMVYKSVISDVGVKFATASNASSGELKVANTKINEWEELTFNFTNLIGHPAMTNIDQIIVFPDFNARTTDNDCYIDNITLGAGVAIQNINVKFAVQAPDSTPVYVFGNWNNWNNFPGTPMVFNNATSSYEATLPMTAGSTIEYQYINGTGTKEVLNPADPCTNGNAQYTNRMVTLGNADTSFCNIWKKCIGCIPTSIQNLNPNKVAVHLKKGTVQINAAEDYLDEMIIYDSYGRTVYTASHVKTNIDIDVPTNLSGIYIVIIKEGNDYLKIKAFVN